MEPDIELINKIGNTLKAKRQSIAIAESVTSGLLQFAFSTAKDAADFYQGGITAYNLAQKFRHLNIDCLHAMRCNCVSEKIAQEMAIEVSKLFTSNWGIGITGYASPVTESEGKLYAWYAISFHQKILTTDKISSPKPEGPETQNWYVNEVMKALMEVIR